MVQHALFIFKILVEIKIGITNKLIPQITFMFRSKATFVQW